MSAKLLVTVRSEERRKEIDQAGCQKLADYPSSVLLSGDGKQERYLRKAGFEVTRLEEPVVEAGGSAFKFAHAKEANAKTPIPEDPNRTNYYLVCMVGPMQGPWLKTIESLGGQVQGHLKGFTSLISLMPAAVAELEKQPWVEATTPYRPTMKVSAKLRKGKPKKLGLAELRAATVAIDQPKEAAQVEINMFPGESAAAVAARIRKGGGMVLSESPTRVVAAVTGKDIDGLAKEVGVRAILPHRFHKLSNDRAAEIMDAPVNRTFSDLTLTGAGEIVAVCDSGLDTGVAATAHADFAGRIAGIASQPNVLGIYSNDPAPFDDGAQDANSGHGTHVAGSVLSNGAAAAATASPDFPQGMAPGAQLYFQAIEQQVTWKTAAELAALGVAAPPWWPPNAVGLYGIPLDLNDLFGQAYMAGARIHTNSWGADNDGVYNAEARQVDEFMWNNRDMLILFSAGNEAEDADANGVIDQDSLNTPGTAKNCLTVGASENNRPTGSSPAPGLDGNWSALVGAGGVALYPALGAAGHVSDDVDGMAAFSSRGPTDDNRIKPDVVAPGTNVLSTRSSVVGANPLWGDLAPADPLNGLYCWSGGTSMATPLTAGAAAIIRQHLVQHRGHHVDGVKPSGALIKAFIVNGAESMAPGQFAGEIPAEPNNVNGFGRVNLTQSLVPGALEQTLFADEPDYAVASGEDRVFQVQAVDLAQPLRVTLAWTDAPGPENVGGLQNQLYLQVAPPGGGAVVDGDVTAYPTASNNVQQVTINPPVAGAYEIRVRGVSITQHAPGVPAGPDPRQDFAVAVSNGMGFSLQPVSIAQAIDTTGSMGFFGFMEPAKERAKQLVNFMRINDKVSITEFSKRSGVPNDARTPYPLRLLGDFTPDWTQAHTAISGLMSNGLTPIGAGLQEAWNQLSGEPVARPRAIVLLSDGFNNSAPDPAAVLPGIPNDVPIFTIALGPAASVATLQNIANSRPNGGYFMIDADEDIFRLHQIYAELQALALGAPMIGLNNFEINSQQEDGEEFPVEEGVSEVSFSLSWDAAAVKDLELRVFDPAGKERNVKTAATLEKRGAGARLVRVAAPKPGMWRASIRNRRSEEPVRCVLSASADAPIRLTAEPLKIEGDQLFISAQLLRKGKPIDGDVVARITAPTVFREEVIEENRDRILEMQLPKQVNEKGLSEAQIFSLKLALFARQFVDKEGGLFGRKTFTVSLKHNGGGVWTATAPLPATGGVTVEVAASGKYDGHAWRRRASLAANSPATAGAAVQSLKKPWLKDVSIRRNSTWLYHLIGVSIVMPNGSAATPEDGIEVRATLVQGGQKFTSYRLDYYRRGQYFVWRLAKKGLLSGEVRVQVKATWNGVLAINETRTIRL